MFRDLQKELFQRDVFLERFPHFLQSTGKEQFAFMDDAYTVAQLLGHIQDVGRKEDAVAGSSMLAHHLFQIER